MTAKSIIVVEFENDAEIADSGNKPAEWEDPEMRFQYIPDLVEHNPYILPKFRLQRFYLRQFWRDLVVVLYFIFHFCCFFNERKQSSRHLQKCKKKKTLRQGLLRQVQIIEGWTKRYLNFAPNQYRSQGGL